MRPHTTLSTLMNAVRALIYGSTLYNLSLSGPTVTELPTIPLDPWPGQREHGATLILNQWTYNGRRLPFQESMDVEQFWYPNTDNHDWFQHLHSFDWLRDLRAYDGDQARRQARRLLIAWLTWNMFWNESTWSPVLLARRVISWITMHEFFWASAEEGLRYCLLNSLARQTRHLMRVVSDDLEPHDLLLVAKGLIYGSLSLVDGQSYRQRAFQSLTRSLSQLVLNDGGCVDRSPYSQYVVLKHLIDMRTVLHAIEVKVPENLQQTIERMVLILRLLCHGDGRLALFNHSYAEDIPLIDLVFHYTPVGHGLGHRPLVRAGDMQFERLVDGETVVLIDVGSPPPRGFDETAHAGTLSFEMSTGRDRIIVNCGSCLLDITEWQSCLRNTAAHSTLTLNNTNTSEVYPKGGIGHRPQNVHCDRNNTAAEIVAQHDAYASRFGFIHQRRLCLEGNGVRLIGEDRLIAVEEYETTEDPLSFTLRFHLHPTIHPLLIPTESTEAHADQADHEAIDQTRSIVQLHFPRSAKTWLFIPQAGNLSLQESIYFGSGTKQSCSQIVIFGEVPASGCRISWILERAEDHVPTE